MNDYELFKDMLTRAGLKFETEVHNNGYKNIYFEIFAGCFGSGDSRGMASFSPENKFLGIHHDD